MTSLPRLTTVLLAAGILATVPAGAQEIRGALRSAETGESIAGAVVTLLRADVRLVRTLSGPGGEFLLTTAGPGAYRLVVERIGFETDTSQVLEVSAAGVAGYLLRITPRPIALEAIAVESERRCSRNEDAPELNRVWQEARKALDVVALTQERGGNRYVVIRYDRELDARTLDVTSERRRVRSLVTRIPVGSLPAEDLAADGYIRISGAGIDYYAPDADVLLSDSFVDQHCFSLTSDEGRPELLGLAFRPMRASGPPDISGVLWLDRESDELRSMDFQYVRLPWPIDDARIGGHIAFERGTDGSWIIGEWWLRMPLLRTRVMAVGRGHDITIGGFHQTGGEVVDRVAAAEREGEAAPVGTPDERRAPAAVEPDSVPADSVVQLPGLDVAVAGERRDPVLARTGFYDRKANSGGRFLLRADIEGMSVRRASEIFERLPGIRTRGSRYTSGLALWMAGAERPGFDGISICGPRLLVNGIEVFAGGDSGPLLIDEFVNLHDVMAIEVYRGASELPARYSGAHSACGVVSVWTG